MEENEVEVNRMADYEKVIKGLECCLGSNDCDIEPKEDCPYKGMCLCAMALGLDVLALLKEQEAVEPKKTAYQRVDHTIAYRYRCGTCDMSIFPSYKYCPFCGQAVKWD
jgi:hypothetical protein